MTNTMVTKVTIVQLNGNKAILISLNEINILGRRRQDYYQY